MTRQNYRHAPARPRLIPAAALGVPLALIVPALLALAWVTRIAVDGGG